MMSMSRTAEIPRAQILRRNPVYQKSRLGRRPRPCKPFPRLTILWWENNAKPACPTFNSQAFSRTQSCGNCDLRRQALISQIRKEGNFLLLDKAYKSGKIIPVRRPTTANKSSGKNFTSRPHCKGLYTKNNIRHHYPQCSRKKTARGVLSQARALEGRVHPEASEIVRALSLPWMNVHEVVRVIREYLLIILYANEFGLRNRREYHHKRIRQYLRQCGVFVIPKSRPSRNHRFPRSIYQVKNYKIIINNRQHYNSANMATSLTRHIIEIGQIYELECIVSDDEKQEGQI